MFTIHEQPRRLNTQEYSDGKDFQLETGGLGIARLFWLIF